MPPYTELTTIMVPTDREVVKDVYYVNLLNATPGGEGRKRVVTVQVKSPDQETGRWNDNAVDAPPITVADDPSNTNPVLATLGSTIFDLYFNFRAASPPKEDEESFNRYQAFREMLQQFTGQDIDGMPIQDVFKLLKGLLSQLQAAPPQGEEEPQ